VKMKEAGARRALVLPVGGAFHSPLMEPARKELAEYIETVEFQTPNCPIYQNVSGLSTTDPEVIKENLLKQLTAPVRWTHTIENMIADGATEFVEVGPGAVLQGLIGQISSEVNAYGA
jgi:[acyl-carrier-protein] S-malonyltransferase